MPDCPDNGPYPWQAPAALTCVHCGRVRPSPPPCYRHVCFQAIADWHRLGGEDWYHGPWTLMTAGLRNLKGEGRR